MLTALVGLVAGAIGAYANARMVGYATMHDFDNALERERRRTRSTGQITAEIARDAALDSELREAVRQFTAAASSMIHSMCWLTWDSIERKRVNPELVKSYDDEIHAQSPLMLSQLAVIAMLDRDAHSKLSPVADAIFLLDVQVSEAIVGEEETPGSQRAKLRTCYEDGLALEGGFRQGVAELLTARKHEPTATAVVPEE